MKLQDLDRESGVVAHFLAHAGVNVHIAALAFNPRYSMYLSLWCIAAKVRSTLEAMRDNITVGNWTWLCKLPRYSSMAQLGNWVSKSSWFINLRSQLFFLLFAIELKKWWCFFAISPSMLSFNLFVFSLWCLSCLHLHVHVPEYIFMLIVLVFLLCVDFPVAICWWLPVLRDTTSMCSTFYPTRGSLPRQLFTTSTLCSEVPQVVWWVAYL